MGNCQCQNYGQPQFKDYEMNAPNIVKVEVPIKKQIQGSRIQASQNIQKVQPAPQQVSHQPSPSFAVQIDKFPTLSQKIIQTDKKLGLFLPNNKLYFNHQSPSHLIKKSFRLFNGVIYQGQWNNGSMNGDGVFCLPDGSFIRGYSTNNQLIGKARYIKNNGDYYEGFVKNNKANGQGIQYSNGILYSGVFVDNFLSGQGSQQNSTYNFKGTYSGGKKLFGKLIWDLDKENQSEYEGEFLQQKFHGYGKLRNKIGQFTGTFQKGKKKGPGVFIWKNGQRFQGNYDNDMKNGQGRMLNNKNVVVLQGVWRNNKFEQ